MMLASCGRWNFDAIVDAGVDAPFLPRMPWAQVAIGGGTACAIAESGELWCWGANGAGQTGAPAAPSVLPHQVGSDVDWTGIAVNGTTCALKAGGTLWCWGSGVYGQLASASLADRDAPAPLDAATDWADVSVGTNHVCARKQDGTALCWGDNQLHEVSPSGLATITTPTMVAGAFATISAGHNSTCAVATDGSRMCWGDNSYAQLGDGDRNLVASPLVIDQGWSVVRLGDTHGCGIRTDGSLWCWGDNTYGQVGDGTTQSRTSPVKVGIDSDWLDLEVGAQHTCARKRDHQLWCWGASARDQLGTLLATDMNAPRLLDSATYRAFAVTDSNLCVIDDVGTLRCAGGNLGGQLGQPPGQRGHPIRVGAGWTTLTMRETTACAIDATSHAACWGGGLYGQIGDGTTRDRKVPVPLGAATWSAIAAGPSRSVGVTSDGALSTWGQDPITFAISPLPTKIDAGPGWTGPSSGAAHACAIKSGTAYCWGGNTYGQLGDGTTNAAPAPIAVGSFTQIAVSPTHTCATDGSVVSCWGDNTNEQLGSPGTHPSPTPVQGLPVVAWAKVLVGYTFSCALSVDGRLFCWGSNGSGQYGNGTTTASGTAVPAGGDIAWRDAVAGDGHVCAIRGDGTLWCWGHGDGGQLGNDTYPSTQPVPQQISTDTTWSALALGYHDTCALQSDGTEWCWGHAEAGQYGDGRAWADGLVTLGGP
jgi:alpha-tubulin suppressor-like RCC1 family protein